MTNSLNNSITAKRQYLFDTSVFVSYWDGNPNAELLIKRVLSEGISCGYSIITEFELWSWGGMKDQQIERDHRIMLKPFKCYEFNKRVARRAGELKRSYGLSPLDALITATAVYHHLILISSDGNLLNKLPKTIIETIALSLSENPLSTPTNTATISKSSANKPSS